MNLPSSQPGLTWNLDERHNLFGYYRFVATDFGMPKHTLHYSCERNRHQHHLGLSMTFARVVAGNRHRAGIRAPNTGQNRHRGAFAGPVRTDQTEDFPGLDTDTRIAERAAPGTTGERRPASRAGERGDPNQRQKRNQSEGVVSRDLHLAGIA